MATSGKEGEGREKRGETEGEGGEIQCEIR